MFTAGVAKYTSQLGKDTVRLARRTAAREHKRRKRQVRGVARLVDGELNVVYASVSTALATTQLQAVSPLPRGAWDRDGALIVETLAKDEAQDLIVAFSTLTTWQSALGEIARVASQPWEALPLPPQAGPEVLTPLKAQVEQARKHLAKLAYPDARDLKPDPDGVPPPVEPDPDGEPPPEPRGNKA